MYSFIILLLPIVLFLLFLSAPIMLASKKWKQALVLLLLLSLINVYYEVVPINLFISNDRNGVSLISYNINSSDKSFSLDSTLQSSLLKDLIEEDADIVVLNEYYKRYCIEEFHSGL